MKPIIKAMWLCSPDYCLDDYIPIRPEYFGFWIELRIGVIGNSSGDDFRVFVCSPDWIRDECSSKTAILGRHMIVFHQFNLAEMKNKIIEVVDECEGVDWEEISRKISRFAAWEFEDYVS
ncbi:immunity 8 family protein [Rugamonas sp. CCM 8940]|uniref:immunity 8 family protein n=1 Tax=Rugamonas sp. CCM 8940 TaxID=2765359 RepID=UPI0018F38CDE|nr:immunity 8 family protein [Rugamonas sp. CCM 8940]MBJ7314334.1 immunity 8 family protein [Rugamonas sp. CCM 8940]